MKAILQAFVDVPEMDPQPLMKNPLDFSLAEVRVMLQCMEACAGPQALVGPNFVHARHNLRFLVHAMQCWNEEHQ